MKKLTLPIFWILLLIVFLNVSCQPDTLTGKSSDEILQKETIENFEGALQTMNRQEKTVEGRLDIRKRKSTPPDSNLFFDNGSYTGSWTNGANGTVFVVYEDS